LEMAVGTSLIVLYSTLSTLTFTTHLLYIYDIQFKCISTSNINFVITLQTM
jgi:hypothetical protein